MRHRVNIVNENLEYDHMSGDSEEDESGVLRRMLQQRMQKDNIRGGRASRGDGAGLGDSNEEDLERGEGSGAEDDEWNGRTGGPIQLEN